MSATSVTVTGTATTASGVPVPNAVISILYNESIINSAAALTGTQAFAATNGTFSISVSATDDSTSSPTTGLATVIIHDPLSGERVQDFACTIPHSVTSQTLTGLLALAVEAPSE